MAEVDPTLWSLENKCAYAAGIFDGEGCVTIPRQPTYRLYVQIDQTIKGYNILFFLRDHFGAAVSNDYQPSGNRQLRRLAFWHSWRAMSFLEKISPYVINKTKQIQLAQEFMAFYANLPGQGRRWSSTSRATADDYYRRMQELNGRGKAQNLLLGKLSEKKKEPTLFDAMPDA